MCSFAVSVSELRHCGHPSAYMLAYTTLFLSITPVFLCWFLHVL